MRRNGRPIPQGQETRLSGHLGYGWSELAGLTRGYYPIDG